jgi:hypothetical protein
VALRDTGTSRDLGDPLAPGLLLGLSMATAARRSSIDARHERARPRWKRFVGRSRRAFSRSGRSLLAIALLLVAARVALPFAVEHYLNRRLARLEGYRGHVEDVDIALLRGAYRLEGLVIHKTGDDVPVPFFRAPAIDISVEWKALLDGAVVAEIVMEHPELNIVAERQTGEEADWRSAIDDMVPLTINRLEIRNGEVHYRDLGREPQVDMRVDRMRLVARNLSTVRDEGAELPARLHVDARVQRSGRLVADARLDPWDEEPTFNLALRLRDLPARELNPMLRAYAGVDAETGTFFLYSEIAAREGRFRGYVKPMAENFSVFQLGEEGDFFDVLGDFFVELVAEVFENHGTDRLAIHVPVQGSFDSPDVSGWAALGSALSNAFIRAIRHGLENPGEWGPDDEVGPRDSEHARESAEDLADPTGD